MCESGDGTEQNLEKAYYWYEKAAENGDQYAMLQCYVMYTMGIGTKMDREKARYWYEQISDETVKEKLQQSPRFKMLAPDLILKD